MISGTSSARKIRRDWFEPRWRQSAPKGAEWSVLGTHQELGLDPPVRPTSGWLTGMVYAIPLERVLIHPVVWYSRKTLWINGSPNDDVPLEPPAEEFEPFDPSRYQELSAPTARHLAYLTRMRERGRRPLMFVHIPHVLVAGPIDVSGLEPVPWDVPPA